MGAVAVLAERPLPDALLPVVVVPDTLRALSALADAFYERPSRRLRTVGLVGRWAPLGMLRGEAAGCEDYCGSGQSVQRQLDV